MTGDQATARRRITKRADITAGWRLFRPFVDEVLTPRRRRVLVAGASVVGVAVSAFARVSYSQANVTGPVRTVVLALATGFFVAQIVSWVLLRLWRPLATQLERTKGAGSMPGDFADDEISRAWAEHREPRTPIAQRLAAAEAARRYREIAPGGVLASFGLAPAFVPFLMAALALLPNFAFFAAVFGAVNAAMTPLTLLGALGRTTAAIETAPDVPDDYWPDGRKKQTPRKSLGTDHPDDYT